MSDAALRSWVDGSNTDGTCLQRIVTLAVGFVAIGAVIELDRVIFDVLFDNDYLHWYLANGALIGITFGLITIAWGDLTR